MNLSSLYESFDSKQESFVAGSVGLSLDRIHIERTHYSLADLGAFIGGLALTGFVAFYLLVFAWQKISRQVFIISNIFYFARKLETKTFSQPLNF